MAELWLKHPRTGAVWLVVHEDTQRRCLSEGYTLAPDPRLPAPAAPLALPPITEATTEATTEAEGAEQVIARNDAARAAFGAPAVRNAHAPNGLGVRKGVKRADS